MVQNLPNAGAKEKNVTCSTWRMLQTSVSIFDKNVEHYSNIPISSVFLLWIRWNGLHNNI